ncbi:MAG: NAD(P)-dependent oxidoreductase [Legionellaceae bacterium]|nr:NAD(P)-dependent oxidoreductase [Legionellaceae bacterium]
MKILITGSNGLLGPEVLRALSDEHQLATLVRATPEIKDGAIEYITCDLSKTFDVALLPKHVDIIIHMAQSPHYREFPEQADHVFRVNCDSTARLLDYARAAGVQHFIFTSTGSVYEPYESQLLESSALAPTSFYANSKLIAERLLASYEAYFKVTVLRLFFLYGPSATPKHTLINMLVNRVKQGEEIVIDGVDSKGLQFVPTLTRDVAHCIRLVIEKGLVGVFNFANPTASSLASIVEALEAQLGVQAKIKYRPDTAALTIVPNLDKFMHDAGDFKFTSLDEGLKYLLCDTHE